MKQLLIIGASGHSKVVSDAIDFKSTNLLGYVDDGIEKGSKFCEKEVLGTTDEIVGNIRTNTPFICKETNNELNYLELSYFIAVGCNFARSKVFSKLSQVLDKNNFINIIHPSSIISKNVVLGKGIFIAPGVIINSASSIGDFSILNTKSSIDHDCVISKFVSINPGVTTGGNVSVGDYSALGIQCAIKHGISIGANSVVGANSYVHNDILKDSLAFGTPAKFIRKREFGEKFL